MGNALRFAGLLVLGSMMACLSGTDDGKSELAQDPKGAAMIATSTGGCLDYGGASHPELFVSFMSSVTTGPCPSSACSDFVMFDTSCQYTLQVKDQEHAVSLDAADCAGFIRWLSSDLLLSSLRDSKCGDSGLESAQVQLQDGWTNRKYGGCQGEAYTIHRACLAQIRTKYFPGI
jgi:hypothetical protein